MSSSVKPHVFTSAEKLNIFFPVGSTIMFYSQNDRNTYYTFITSTYEDSTFEKGVMLDKQNRSYYYVKRTA